MAEKEPPRQGGRKDSIGDAAKFGVLTVSDRASHGVYADLSGPAILRFFEEAIDSRCPLLSILQNSLMAVAIESQGMICLAQESRTSLNMKL